MSERYIDFKHNRIIDSTLDADGFFACGKREQRAQALFKEVGLFCKVAADSALPVWSLRKNLRGWSGLLKRIAPDNPKPVNRI